MKKRDLRTAADLAPDELQEIFALTARMKEHPDRYTNCLAGKTMAMINEKQSLRTKVTFEAGIQQLGGYSVYLTNHDINLGKREPVKDVARNLSRWVDVIVARVFKQNTILELSEYSNIPVINALSDEEHPCQAITDMFTLWDLVKKRESLKGYRLVYIGDGNNVCNSLMLVTSLLGMRFTACAPDGYQPNETVLRQSEGLAKKTGASLELITDPKAAVKEADAIYTDVWASMGQEDDAERRKTVFQSYQVNNELLDYAPNHAVIMHCLPAHRGEEITESALESNRSIVFDQAENRLHGQKALMKFLIDWKE